VALVLVAIIFAIVCIAVISQTSAGSQLLHVIGRLTARVPVPAVLLPVTLRLRHWWLQATLTLTVQRRRRSKGSSSSSRKKGADSYDAPAEGHSSSNNHHHHHGPVTNGHNNHET
jgi:preprotein translocase subunit SecG